LAQRRGSYDGAFDGHPITDIKNAFNGAVDRAKIQDFRFHDLRHTFCSWLALRGVSITAIQKLAGHTSIKMTLRYAHLSPRYLADEVGTLDRIQEANTGTSQSEADTAGPDSREDSFLASVRARSRRSTAGQQAVKADKPGHAMRGTGKK